MDTALWRACLCGNFVSVNRMTYYAMYDLRAFFETQQSQRRKKEIERKRVRVCVSE